jgi:hypothetical protein
MYIFHKELKLVMDTFIELYILLGNNGIIYTCGLVPRKIMRYKIMYVNNLITSFSYFDQL